VVIADLGVREKMMHKIGLCLFIACFLTGSVRYVEAQTGAKTIIDRAIKAHGGAGKIARLKIARIKMQGVMLEGGKEIPLNLEDAWQLPGHYRTQSQVELNGSKMTRILTINGDRGWTSLNGNAQDMDAAAMAEMKEQVYSESFDKLFPLLNLSAYNVSVLADSEVNGHKVKGVRISSTGHRAVRLYFDAVTGLLAKRAEKMQGDNGREVLREVVFSDYKELEGLKQAMKLTAFFDGKKVIEGKVIEIKFYDKQEPSVFAKP
jgi:hypothetical protein